MLAYIGKLKRLERLAQKADQKTSKKTFVLYPKSLLLTQDISTYLDPAFWILSDSEQNQGSESEFDADADAAKYRL